MGSMANEDKNLVWAKDDKVNDVVTLETVPKKDGDKPGKLKSMTYKG